MKTLFAFCIIFALVFVSARGASAGPIAVTPDQVKWTAGTGHFSGIEVAVLSGDPTKSGPYTLREKIPDGHKFRPHYHANDESVTILQGTLLFCFADHCSPQQMKVLPAGSFIFVPAGVHHYGVAKGETIAELHANAPHKTTYITSKT